jgi:hypothetical protein
MKTNNIKSFAKRARLILMEGVSNRLKYWGFDANGTLQDAVESTGGGYILRGKVYNDPSVPEKWNKLKAKIKDKQSVEDLIEEAAYTWFNRLMAIKILEVNGYIEPQLRFTEGTRIPTIVQNAKRGQHILKKAHNLALLKEYLLENREEEALGLLLNRYCNNQTLLHDVFGRIDDYTALLLPTNLLQTDGLLDLINSELIEETDYKEVELIGWLYQFYISDKKDKVFADFKKNKKARAEDIPAATQIFTPKWIVKYMVENTVGKIYLDYEPGSSLREQMKYLVETPQSSEPQKAKEIKQAADLFDKPEEASDDKPLINDITQLTLLDPASGSGHILVTGFELLFKMYREEGYTSRQAVESILQHNLFGLDIDDRAMQLARFAVLLKAAQYDAGILSRGIIPHVYSFPEAAFFTTEELHTFLGTEGQAYTAELKTALNLLNQGKNIGSALKLQLSSEAHTFIQSRYYAWLEKDRQASLDIDATGIWQHLKAFLEVLLVMSRQYTAVVANPPYMGQKNMNGELKEYINSYYPMTKSDLFAVFMEVCLGFTFKRGLMGMINQHSWMFLSSFKKLRAEIISNYHISSMLHLGPRTFEELSGEVVQSTTFVIKNVALGADNYNGTYFRLVDYRNNLEKEKYFLKSANCYPNIPQSNFSKIPGSPIAYWASDRVIQIFENNIILDNIGLVRQGASTSDNDRFLRFWQEVDIKKVGFKIVSLDSANQSGFRWFPYNKGGSYRKWIGNFEYLINYENDGYELKKFQSTLNQGWTVRLKSREYYFHPSVSWSKISSGSFSARYYPNGFIFDVAGCCYFPTEERLSKQIIAFLNSQVAQKFLEFISPTLNYEIEQIKRLPFIEIKNNTIKELDNVFNLSIADWDSKETSWDFEKSPLINEGFKLNLAYKLWEQQATEDFFQLHANEEELNRIFIDIYGLPEELTPEVKLKDITILQEELDSNALEALEPIFRTKGKNAIALPIKKEEVISQFISYTIGIMMGRYRLDKPGLHIAHPNPLEEELKCYTYNSQRIDIDEDAILPIMGDDGSFADDVLSQLKHLLIAIWGEETLTENINFMQECLGMSLHKWITEKFWSYHTRMYKKKPIYWMFCSNPAQPQKAAFRVITYMHRMDRFTVQQIQRKYLYPHQEYIREAIRSLRDNESSLGKQELKRLEQLQQWEMECRNYNEVLKELANQQIAFDLDDGVSVNYAKFEGAVAAI